MYKLLILIITAVISSTCSAIEIVTSTTNLASLIKMLTKEHLEVSSIILQDACPHHYQIKFSDVDKVKNANLIIYIDDEFDGFINKLNEKNTNVIKMSNFIKPHLIKENNKINWHFWLDLNLIHNVVLPELACIICKHYPHLDSEINSNLKLAQQQIKKLDEIKRELITEHSNIALATDSLVYFFRGLKNVPQIVELYKFEQSGFKYIKLLKKLSRQEQLNCILLSTEQDLKIYQNFNLPYLTIDSENWQLTDNLSDLYYKKYLEIIHKISEICY